MAKITCRPAQVLDMKRIKEIVSLSFAEAARHPDVLDDLENETWYSTEHWVVAEADGQVVSALGLRPGVMWMSGVPVPTSTVGTVCTHPDLRARGIGRELMAFADDVMQEQGVVLSRLHTSAQRFGFYGRCGYVKAVTNQAISVFDTDLIRARTREKAEEALGDGVIRAAQARDAARMLEIYEATYARGTGRLSRNEHFFLRRIARRGKLWFWIPPRFEVVEDPAEGVVGYAAFLLEEEYKAVVELAVLPHHAPLARTLLLHVARQAQERNIHKVNVHIDEHHPLGWVVHEFPMHVQPDVFVLFLKVQDERRFVELMKPVIEERLAHFEVRLTISIAGLGDTVLGEGQEVRVVTDPRHFAALVYNGAWLAGLLGHGALLFEPETLVAHRALQLVFPDTHASRCPLDGY
ncbi:MAG: hypothetical protein AMS16_04175 [Planctomycetes bacterium DG_58]|nr:MAG: hypothetical protein AMS16_04175 [Planctomycetes bacterium DG_58]